MSTNTSEHMAAFKAAYAALNAAQKKAVDTIEGPVMVIAGPGTGKTQVLTLRIANILLSTDTQPENILALTFTESGAKAMRTRLRQYIGAAAYRVPIYTFHGFAGRLIAQYPDAFPTIIGGTPIGDIEQITILERILASSEIKLLRPMGDPSYYVAPLKRMIGSLKQEYVSPDALAVIIAAQEAELLDIERVHTKGAHKGKVRGEYTKKEKTIAKNQELLFVYRAYEASLKDVKKFDFEDMLLSAVVALQNNQDMLFDLQETYQYVLADEHQDVNGAQNTLLEKLVSFHDNPNLFVVGDEKQAIYRFQGASLENFLHFEAAFPATTTISLRSNYRSGQNILDVAQSLMATDDVDLQKLRIPLTADLVPVSLVTMSSYPDTLIEDGELISRIKQELHNGVPAQEVAIIVRTNKEVEQIAGLLRKEGLTVAASADGDILTHAITRHVIELLEAVASPASEASLTTILTAPYWGIATSDVVRIMSARSYANPLQALITDMTRLEDLGVQSIPTVQKISEVLETARVRAVSDAPQRVLEYLLQDSGFLDMVVQNDAIEGIRVIRRLYDEVVTLVERKEITSVKDIVQALKTRVSYNLPLVAPYISTSDSAIAVMTAHKSKGLEFEVVFMPHLIDSLWGGAAKRQLFDVPIVAHKTSEITDSIDDERRLLFVGLTRAKTALHLSYSERGSDGRENNPSRLLLEMTDSPIQVLDTKASSAAFDISHTLFLAEPRFAIEASLLKHLFLQRGFSATSLNNYLRSPYDYLFRNILRVPELQPLHMQYGTVVHNVLQSATASYTQTQVVPGVNELITWLHRELGKLPITTSEYTQLHEKGLLALTTYIAHTSPTWSPHTKEEMSISVALPTTLPDLPEIKLTGKLDRLDLDEAGFAHAVYDYKTGKPKTRNAIEGTTKSDDGGYKRQLVFYALLLSLYDDERYRDCKTGVLSFVEADTKGVIHEEAFTITDVEIEALKLEIIDAAQAIVTGAFLTTPCDPATSSYCHLL